METCWYPGKTLAQLEKEAIFEALKFYRGNKTTTAQSLGIAIRTLDNKLALYQEEENAQRIRDEQEKRDREAYLARARGQTPTPQIGEMETRNQNASTGLRLESTFGITEEFTVPLPKQEKVQAVLPKKASPGRPRKTGT